MKAFLLSLFTRTASVKLPSLSINKSVYICRVFVLAEPEVFSGSLMHVLSGDFEASTSASEEFLNPLDLMRYVVQHSIQAALGEEQCNGPNLARALKVSIIIQYFGWLCKITGDVSRMLFSLFWLDLSENYISNFPYFSFHQ